MGKHLNDKIVFANYCLVEIQSTEPPSSNRDKWLRNDWYTFSYIKIFYLKFYVSYINIYYLSMYQILIK